MKIYILIIALSIGLFVQAQAHKKPNIEEMHDRKWQFMVENAQLLSIDAEMAKPVFMEYEQAVWKLMEQNKGFFHKSGFDKKNNSKMNYEEMNDKFVNFEIQKSQLLKVYYSKLKKILKAETIFKLLSAERSFRKELIKNWQGKGGGSNYKKPNIILQDSNF